MSHCFRTFAAVTAVYVSSPGRRTSSAEEEEQCGGGGVGGASPPLGGSPCWDIQAQQRKDKETVCSSRGSAGCDPYQ